MLKRDYANYGDSQYTVKHIFRNYQITMASFMGHIAIDLIDHELIK